MQVPFLVQEDPLEEQMATHSSILAWRIPMELSPSVEWCGCGLGPSPARASSGKTRGFHTQLDEGPETP